MEKETKETHEHEFNITEENYISNNTIRITLECNSCKIKFSGVVFEE